MVVFVLQKRFCPKNVLRVSCVSIALLLCNIYLFTFILIFIILVFLSRSECEKLIDNANRNKRKEEKCFYNVTFMF